MVCKVHERHERAILSMVTRRQRGDASVLLGIFLFSPFIPSRPTDIGAAHVDTSSLVCPPQNIFTNIPSLQFINLLGNSPPSQFNGQDETITEIIKQTEL